MRYLYYKSSKGNFGDDLNGWLWPKIFGEEKGSSDLGFLGIGSILHSDSHILKEGKDFRKVIFGTGIKPSLGYKNLKIDDSFDIRFLRGPLSAYALGNVHPFISDAAYAIRALPDFNQLQDQEKKYDISLMPYFHSVNYYDWPKICEDLGYHYISPLSENGVEFTLKEIAASKSIITEAMHGAILADALRVPWHRFVFSTPSTEGGRISDFKWMDWCLSIGIYNPEVSYISFFVKNSLSKYVRRLSGGSISVEFLRRQSSRNKLLEKLKNIESFSISSDVVLEEIDRKMLAEIVRLKKDIG